MSICLNCGADTVAERSKADHFRLMGIIRAAHHHWPERHRFKPIGNTETVKFEHLRAWLFCQAGYCWIDQLDTASASGVSKDSAAETARVFFAAIDARQGHKFWWPSEDGITRCRTARSANFDSLDQKGFNDLRDAVCAVIEHELNISVSRLLKEHEAAA